METADVIAAGALPQCPVPGHLRLVGPVHLLDGEGLEHVAQVIVGNEVLLKCEIPSFVSDFVSVSDWVDSEGIMYSPSSTLGKNMIKLSNG